jgi:hypothetical protein
MANKFFFSEDGLTFIDLSQVSGITKNRISPTFHVLLRDTDQYMEVDSDTATELFEALREYSIG